MPIDLNSRLDTINLAMSFSNMLNKENIKTLFEVAQNPKRMVNKLVKTFKNTANWLAVMKEANNAYNFKDGIYKNNDQRIFWLKFAAVAEKKIDFHKCDKYNFDVATQYFILKSKMNEVTETDKESFKIVLENANNDQKKSIRNIFGENPDFKLLILLNEKKSRNEKKMPEDIGHKTRLSLAETKEDENEIRTYSQFQGRRPSLAFSTTESVTIDDLIADEEIIFFDEYEEEEKEN